MKNYPIIYNKYFNITPKQTSNTSPFKLTTNNYYGSGYEVFRIFDGVSSGTWGWCSSSGTTKNIYFTIDFKEKVPLSAIKIYNGSYASYTPKEVVVSGCNDGVNYIEIATVIHKSSANDILDFGKCAYYRYYKFFIKSNNGNTSYMTLPEMELLCSIYIPKYLIYHDGVYKTLDTNGIDLVTVNDISAIKDKDNYDITKFTYDLVGLNKALKTLSGNAKIISNVATTRNITGVVKKQEMIAMNTNVTTKIAKNIKSLSSVFKVDTKSNIKFVVSMDNGNIYNYYTEGVWKPLNITIVDKKYNEMNQTELNNWNDACTQIIEKGNLLSTINTLNFNTDEKNLRFAFVFYTEGDAGVECNLSSISYNYDEIDRLRSLSEEKVERYIYSDTVLIQPKTNYTKLYVNINTNGLRN